MPVDSNPLNPFALDSDRLVMLDAIREALLDPSPRRIGRLDQWGLADTYESYGEIGTYSEVPVIMADGTRLDAAFSKPRDLAPGQAIPAVVLPAPLIDIGRLAYLGMLPHWILGGYAVLAYSQRGLAASEGKIDVAGPQDVADGSEIINWLAQRDGVDPDRIGCFGSSYGAGTSLLLAAKDSRVKAVAGTSAWGDLFASLYENGTRHVKAFEALVQLFGEDRCSAEFRGVIAKIRKNTVDDEVREFARLRSPIRYVDALTAAGTAILLGTSWHETIFAVPSVVELFGALTGPKSLLIQIGDHGNAELPGLFGGISKPTGMAYRWLDHYLGGSAGDGAAPRFDVRSEHMYNLLSDVRYPDWASFALPQKRFYLAAAGHDPQLAENEPQSGWTRAITATGVDAAVVVAPKLVQTGLAERIGLPHVYKTTEIDGEAAAGWTSAPQTQAMRIQGELTLRVTVTPKAQQATIVAYLMDRDPAGGNACIITHAPYTISNASADQATTVTVALQPAHYVLARGHQLQLILATHDGFFADANTSGSRVEISSPSSTESYLDVPLQSLD